MHLGCGLGQHAKQLRDGMQEVTHDHDNQGFEEEPIGVHPWSAGIAFFGRWRDWRAVDQFDEGDKQTLLAYHRGYLHISFLPVQNPVTTVVKPPQERPPKGHPTLR